VGIVTLLLPLALKDQHSTYPYSRYMPSFYRR